MCLHALCEDLYIYILFLYCLETLLAHILYAYVDNRSLDAYIYMYCIYTYAAALRIYNHIWNI
jgi:hypothetical protein